jgi:O-antigen/teichoic acid export membrane protein
MAPMRASADTTTPQADAHDVLASGEAGPAAIRGGVVRVGGYAVGVVASVLSAALLFRHLGVERGGEYVTVLSLVTLAGGVTDAGLTAIGVREFATRAPRERRPLLRSLIGVRIVLTAAGVLGATAFAIVAGYGSPLVAGTAVAGTGLVLQAIQGTLAIGLLAQLRLGAVTALDLVRQIASVACIVALVLAGAGLLWFWAIPVPVGVLVLALTAAYVRREMPLVPAFRLGAWRLLLRDVVPFAVATAVAAVYFRVAIVIVSLVSPGEQTGYFGASFRVIEVMIIVPSLLVGSAFPIFAHAAHNDRERLGYALGRTFDACLILGIGVALAIAIGAPFIISVVAGPDFEPSADVLRIQGAALAVSFGAAVFGYGLLSLRRHRAILAVSLTGLLASAVLTLVLTETDGARGAAAATAAAEVVLAVGLALALGRTGDVRVQVAWRTIPRVLLAAALAVLVILTALPAVVEAVVAVAVYGVGLVVLRALPAELVEEARRRSPWGRRRSVPPAA